jgi:predicted RNA-binding Zn-ribbon protein involved in translation (DUF1610 family)
MTNIYKIIETPESQIMKHIVSNGPAPIPQGVPQSGNIAEINFVCPGCKNAIKIQANLMTHSDLKAGLISFPVDNNIMRCPNCGLENNLTSIRLQIEAQSRKKIVE